jgi:hypothetical protein
VETRKTIRRPYDYQRRTVKISRLNDGWRRILKTKRMMTSGQSRNHKKAKSSPIEISEISKKMTVDQRRRTV